jgi:prepilin-type N-terminal cleavage/methylation domain-containing protein
MTGQLVGVRGETDGNVGRPHAGEPAGSVRDAESAPGVGRLPRETGSVRLRAPARRGPRRGFTLLEVVIALGILAVGMTVLLQTQATAVVMTSEADKVRVGTLLAQEKMAECQLLVEKNGFSSDDVEDDGDFQDYGAEDFRADVGDIDMEGALDDYRWAYTIRQIELTMPDDLTGTATDLINQGYLGEDVKSSYEASETDEESLDLSDMGLSSDMVTDQLSNYIREVRVMVWWSDEQDEEGNYLDSVELVTHIINPSGFVISGEDTGA